MAVSKGCASRLSSGIEDCPGAEKAGKLSPWRSRDEDAGTPTLRVLGGGHSLRKYNERSNCREKAHDGGTAVAATYFNRDERTHSGASGCSASRVDEDCKYREGRGERDARKARGKATTLSPRHCDGELELYASTSLVTGPTAEMTQVPSSSYEDSSASEVYMSQADSTVSKVNRSQATLGEGVSLAEKQVDRYCVINPDEADANSNPAPSVPATRCNASSPTKRSSLSTTSILQLKIEQLSAKYESMASDEAESYSVRKDDDKVANPVASRKNPSSEALMSSEHGSHNSIPEEVGLAASYDDGISSLGFVDISTPMLLMRADNLKNKSFFVGAVGSGKGLDDVGDSPDAAANEIPTSATPAPRCNALSPTGSASSSATSMLTSKIDELTAKYESMASYEARLRKHGGEKNNVGVRERNPFCTASMAPKHRSHNSIPEEVDVAALDDDGISSIGLVDLGTPRLLMRLDKFRNKSFSVGSAGSGGGADGISDGPDTPNLTMNVDQSFLSNSDDATAKKKTAPSAPASRRNTSSPTKSSSPSSTSISKSERGRVAGKESITFNESETSGVKEDSGEVAKAGARRNNRFFPERALSKHGSDNGISNQVDGHPLPSIPAIKRQIPSNRRHLQGVAKNKGRDGGGRPKDQGNPITSISFRRANPKRQNPQQSGMAASPSPTSGLKLQRTWSQDSIEEFRAMSEDEDMSTLSKATGCTTIGSLSGATASSAEVESHVRLVVHDIAAKEAGNAGLMKEELETALKNKMRLEQQVKKLLRKNDEQSAQLVRERREKKIARDIFVQEMETHLERKASELKSLVDMALSQAEESERQALELARRDMDKQVSMLQYRLVAVRVNGVPIDESLQNAFELVESNQRALRQAAENDVKSAINLKTDIGQSLVKAAAEFEAWSGKQLAIMQSKWLNLSCPND